MSCITTANPLPCCVSDLIIGTANTQYNYTVYLRTPTGRIDTYAGAFIYGTQHLSIADPDVRIGELYEIWITKDTGEINDRETFAVGGVNYTAVYQEFQYCDNAASTQTISIA